MITNLKNLLLLRNMRKKSNRFGSLADINDLAFSILSMEEDKSLSKFIYCNRIACHLLNVSEENVLGKSVNNIMPDLIRSYHDLFIKKFY